MSNQAQSRGGWSGLLVAGLLGVLTGAAGMGVEPRERAERAPSRADDTRNGEIRLTGHSIRQIILVSRRRCPIDADSGVAGSVRAIAADPQSAVSFAGCWARP